MFGPDDRKEIKVSKEMGGIAQSSPVFTSTLLPFSLAAPLCGSGRREETEQVFHECNQGTGSTFWVTRASVESEYENRHSCCPSVSPPLC